MTDYVRAGGDHYLQSRKSWLEDRIKQLAEALERSAGIHDFDVMPKLVSEISEALQLRDAHG